MANKPLEDSDPKTAVKSSNRDSNEMAMAEDFSKTSMLFEHLFDSDKGIVPLELEKATVNTRLASIRAIAAKIANIKAFVNSAISQRVRTAGSRLNLIQLQFEDASKIALADYQKRMNELNEETDVAIIDALAKHEVAEADYRERRDEARVEFHNAKWQAEQDVKTAEDALRFQKIYIGGDPNFKVTKTNFQAAHKMQFIIALCCFIAEVIGSTVIFESSENFLVGFPISVLIGAYFSVLVYFIGSHLQKTLTYRSAKFTFRSFEEKFPDALVKPIARKDTWFFALSCFAFIIGATALVAYRYYLYTQNPKIGVWALVTTGVLLAFTVGGIMFETFFTPSIDQIEEDEYFRLEAELKKKEAAITQVKETVVEQPAGIDQELERIFSIYNEVADDYIYELLAPSREASESVKEVYASIQHAASLTKHFSDESEDALKRVIQLFGRKFRLLPNELFSSEELTALMLDFIIKPKNFDDEQLQAKEFQYSMLIPPLRIVNFKERVSLVKKEIVENKKPLVERDTPAGAAERERIQALQAEELRQEELRKKTEEERRRFEEQLENFNLPRVDDVGDVNLLSSENTLQENIDDTEPNEDELFFESVFNPTPVVEDAQENIVENFEIIPAETKAAVMPSDLNLVPIRKDKDSSEVKEQKINE